MTSSFAGLCFPRGFFFFDDGSERVRGSFLNFQLGLDLEQLVLKGRDLQVLDFILSNEAVLLRFQVGDGFA